MNRVFSACQPLGLLLGFLLTLLASSGAYAQCPIAATCTPGTASDPTAQFFGMGIYQVQLGAINRPSGGFSDGYQDLSCATSTTLTAGSSYTITVRTGSLAFENVRVWVDFNNNGILNATTELFFSSNNALVHTGATALVPITAVLNTPLRMRISADATTAPLPSPCSTPQFSQVEDYGITIIANTQPPVASFLVAPSSSCGTFRFTDQSQRGPSSWFWDFGDGQTSTQQNPSHTFTPGTYSVRLRVCNALGCDSLLLPDAVRLYAPLAPSPCTPITTAYCCNYGITQVDFAGQSQASADASVGYEDFSCLRRFEVQQGQSYSLRVQTGAIAHTARAWIDYDNDGSFTATELVLDEPSAISPTASVQIATGGVVNTPLRMRIIVDAVGQPATACGNPRQGQVEDYSIVVVAPGSCASLQPLKPLTGSFALCNGRSSILALPNPQVGAALQWQTSADSLSWTDITAATTPTYQTGPVLAPAYYRVKATCGAAQRTTAARLVTPDPAMCYCSNLYQIGNCLPDSMRLERVWIPYTSLDNPAQPCANSGAEAHHIFDAYPPHLTATLHRGNTYQLNILAFGRFDVQYGIDYNHDGTFSSTEFAIIATSIPGIPVTAVFRVPTTAVLGQTGLRIRAGNSNSACTQNYIGETHDYTITIAPDQCATPVRGGAIQGNTTFCPSSGPSLSLLGQSPGTTLQWQTSLDSVNWQDLPGQTRRVLNGSQIHDTIFVRVRASCALGTGVTAAVQILPDFQLCFCTPAASILTCGYEYLRKFRIGNTTLVSTTSTCPRTSYGLNDPTIAANTATLLRGISYPLVAVPIRVGSIIDPGIRTFAWLDANQDGEFSDAEGVELDNIDFPNDSIFTLTVPPDAHLGLTRLRVFSRLDGQVFSGRSTCSVVPMPPPYFNRGEEIRDYFITVAASPPAPGPPQLDSLSGVHRICKNTGTRLTLPAYSYGARLQWQQQLGTGLWQNIPGAGGAFLLTHALTRPTRYRVRATTATDTTYTPPFAVDTTGLCPCVQGIGGDVQNQQNNIIDGLMIQGVNRFLLNRNQSTTLVPPGPLTPQSSLYTNYSTGPDSLFVTLLRGQQNRFYVLTPPPTTPTSSGAVWFDYNRNGIFETSEYHPLSALVGGGNTASWVNIPATAPLGPVSMRLRTVGSGRTLTPGDACTNFPDGETEDYVVIMANPAPFAAPEITFTGRTCTGGSVQLRTQRPLPFGTIVQWQGPNGFSSTAAQPSLTNLATNQSGYYFLTVEHAGLKLTSARFLQVETCTGLAESSTEERAFTLYPNPTSGFTTVHVGTTTGSNLELRILNGLGQTILFQKFPNDKSIQDILLDLRLYTRGIYVVQVVSSNGARYQKLVVE